MRERLTPSPGVEVEAATYARNAVRAEGRVRLRSGMVVVRDGDASLPFIGVIRNVRRDGRVSVTWFDPALETQLIGADGSAELPRFTETLPADQVAAITGQLKALV